MEFFTLIVLAGLFCSSFSKLMENKCKEKGNLTAIDDIKKGNEVAEKCFSSLTNPKDLNEELKTANSKDIYLILGLKICKKPSDFLKCLNNLLLDMEPCLNSSERANKQIILNIFEVTLKFICSENGEPIKNLFANGGEKCFFSTARGVEKCLVSFYEESLKKSTANIKSLGDLLLPFYVWDQKSCRNIMGLQKCLKTEFRKCENKTTLFFVNSLFNATGKVTPCETISQNTSNLLTWLQKIVTFLSIL